MFLLMCHICDYFKRLFIASSAIILYSCSCVGPATLCAVLCSEVILSTRGITRLHSFILSCIFYTFFFLLSESLYSFAVCACVDERESYNQVGITFTTFTHVTDVYTHPNLYLMSTAATPHMAIARQSEHRQLVLGLRGAGVLCALFIITTHRQHLQHLS